MMRKEFAQNLVFITIFILIVLFILYFVNKIINKQKNNNILQLKKKIYNFVKVLNFNQDSEKMKKYSKYIDILKKKIFHTLFYENEGFKLNGIIHTTFTVNKGQSMHVCFKNQNNNDVFYVVLHELAHIACPEEGHTKLFEEIYRFFLEVAIEKKFYNFIDYSKNPLNYCGYLINENILH